MLVSNEIPPPLTVGIRNASVKKDADGDSWLFQFLVKIVAFDWVLGSLDKDLQTPKS